MLSPRVTDEQNRLLGELARELGLSGKAGVLPRLIRPVPFKGQFGLFNVPDDLVERTRRRQAVALGYPSMVRGLGKGRKPSALSSVRMAVAPIRL